MVKTSKMIVIGTLLMVSGVVLGGGLVTGLRYGYDNHPIATQAIDGFGCLLADIPSKCE